MTRSFTLTHWRQWNTKPCFSTITIALILNIRKISTGDYWLMTTLTSRHMLTQDTLHHKEVHMLIHINNRNWQSAKFWAKKRIRDPSSNMIFNQEFSQGRASFQELQIRMKPLLMILSILSAHLLKHLISSSKIKSMKFSK